MFTGLIQALGIVISAADSPAGKRLTVSLAELADARITPGDSICVSGVCLTAVKSANGSVQFDVVQETLTRSTLGSKIPQDRVNLELSLRGDSLIGGHFVQGHVDAVGTNTDGQTDPRDWRITIAVPPSALPAIAPKGSIAVEGVSMTIADVQAESFSVAVVPTTLEKTTLSALQIGDRVNLETDILARTVIHFLEQTRQPKAHSDGGRPGTTLMPHSADRPEGVSLAKLRELGFA